MIVGESSPSASLIVRVPLGVVPSSSVIDPVETPPQTESCSSTSVMVTV